MLCVVRTKASQKEIEAMSVDLMGYIKLVVDVEREILAGGGKRHVEGEQELLANGSKQSDLWGGGIDWDTKQIDYNSIINLRVREGNPSREILSEKLRKKFDTIVKRLLL